MPPASCVADWPTPSPSCPPPSSTVMPRLKMMTSRSLETIIAATNSIHRRTQDRVMSAVAPENASGARTAASSSMSLRIIMAAQTMTTRRARRGRRARWWRGCPSRRGRRTRASVPGRRCWCRGCSSTTPSAEGVDAGDEQPRGGEGEGRPDEADEEAGERATEAAGWPRRSGGDDLDEEQAQAQDGGDGGGRAQLGGQCGGAQVEGGGGVDLLPQPGRGTRSRPGRSRQPSG